MQTTTLTTEVYALPCEEAQIAGPSRVPASKV
jgi:hypothetical protein